MSRPPWVLTIVFDAFLTDGGVAEESANIAAKRAKELFGFRHVRVEGGRSYPTLTISWIEEMSLPEMNRFLADAYEDYHLHRVEIARLPIHIEKTLRARREQERKTA